MLELTEITKTFTGGAEPLQILRGISLTVQSGQRIAIVGSSGSGKSTLLSIMAGLDQPTSGRVILDGVDLTTSSESAITELRRQSIGYIFQSFELVESLTALENVLLPAALDGKNQLARAEELLARVGLRDRLTHYPSELSGGEQQRVALARALINQPKIIFADEPTGSLDERTGGEVFALLRDFTEEHQTALVLITHDRALSRTMDLVYELSDGVLHQVL